MNKKGFSNIAIIILTLIVVLGIGGYFMFNSDTDTTTEPSPTPGIETTGGAGGRDGQLQFPDASITLLSPNGGEVYEAGSQMTIEWETENISPESGIWIHLNTPDGKHLDNGDLVSSWTEALNNGEKTITIPADIPAGQYKVAVTVGQEHEDVSDNYITITSADPNQN